MIITLISSKNLGVCRNMKHTVGEFEKSEMTCLYITVSAVLPTSSSKDSNICGTPILECTVESCKNGMGWGFEVQSTKKIYWKKPLNGKIRLKFGGNSGK